MFLIFFSQVSDSLSLLLYSLHVRLLRALIKINQSTIHNKSKQVEFESLTALYHHTTNKCILWVQNDERNRNECVTTWSADGPHAKSRCIYTLPRTFTYRYLNCNRSSRILARQTRIKRLAKLTSSNLETQIEISHQQSCLPTVPALRCWVDSATELIQSCRRIAKSEITQLHENLIQYQHRRRRRLLGGLEVRTGHYAIAACLQCLVISLAR